MIIQRNYSLQEAAERRETLTVELNNLVVATQNQMKQSSKLDLEPLAEKLSELTEINKIIAEKKQEISLKKRKCCKLGSWCGGNAKLGTWVVLGTQALFSFGAIAISVYVYRSQQEDSKCSKEGPALLAQLISEVVCTGFGFLAVEGIRELSAQNDQNEILNAVEDVRDQGEKNMEKMLEIFKNFEEKNNRVQFALGCHFIKDLQKSSLGEHLEPSIWISHILERLSAKDIEVKNKMEELEKAAKEIKEKQLTGSQEKQKESAVSQEKKMSVIEIGSQFFKSQISLEDSEEEIGGEKGAFSFGKQTFLIEEKSEEQKKFDRLWSAFEEELCAGSIDSIKMGGRSITREGDVKKIETDTIIEMN